ncbi:hypothetical protein NLI96_g9773 [Meripilus lineatus]|uniref:Uncharacterized protein n=1 Tax=Meripilus lineatus TaxID=2056292 RepID=A0AAD5V020_9APHY|nr:hypothetical protein NLI96_g9773 [Physisporinus lineatus]
METLPVELHSHILQLACTDDGSTARTLSLVSKYVHQIADPFLSQTLIVSGSDRLNLVANKLITSPNLRRRVRHLFLSDQKPHETPASDQQTPPTPDDVPIQSQEGNEMPLIIQILDLTSQSLHSLGLNISNPRISPHLLGHVFSMTFPRLYTLLAHGLYPFPYLPRSLPQLEYLHLSGNRNPHGLFQTGGLAAACPNLTRVKISGLMYARSFIKELEDILHPIMEDGDSYSEIHHPPPALPPHLQHIAVAPGFFHAPKSWCPSPRGCTDNTLERLKKLEECSEKSGDVELQVGELRNAHDVSSALLSEWLEAMC